MGLDNRNNQSGRLVSTQATGKVLLSLATHHMTTSLGSLTRYVSELDFLCRSKGQKEQTKERFRGAELRLGPLPQKRTILGAGTSTMPHDPTILGITCGRTTNSHPTCLLRVHIAPQYRMPGQTGCPKRVIKLHATSQSPSSHCSAPTASDTGCTIKGA